MKQKIEKAADDCYYHNHAYARESYIEGANFVLKNLWHDAQGDNLPEIDREVIVIDKRGRISYAHISGPDDLDSVIIDPDDEIEW